MAFRSPYTQIRPHRGDAEGRKAVKHQRWISVTQSAVHCAGHNMNRSKCYTGAISVQAHYQGNNTVPQDSILGDLKVSKYQIPAGFFG